MRLSRFHFALLFLLLAGFLLACRTAELLTGSGAPPTAARSQITRAAQRPTFTPFPTETEVPPPTETPEPTDVPPTDEPTETPPPTRRPATRRPPTAVPPTATSVPPTAQPTPTVVLPWVVSAGPTCDGGDDKESAVTGTIKANDKPAVGQFVQASSGAGGEPISEVPAQSDSKGNYKVTFICGGKACNGDFWVWMVDANRKQISQFVKFGFSGGCRQGHVDFKKR